MRLEQRSLSCACAVVLAAAGACSRVDSATSSGASSASASASALAPVPAPASAPAPSLSPAPPSALVPAPARSALDAAPAYRATVRAGRASIDGALAPAAIDAVVRGAFPRLRLCFENAASARADVTVRFVIARDGRVIDAHDVALVDAATAPLAPLAPLNRCVVRVLESLTFPEPVSGIVAVIYPLAFEAPR